MIFLRILIVILAILMIAYTCIAKEIRILSPKPGSTILNRTAQVHLILAIKGNGQNQIKVKKENEIIEPFGIWKKNNTYYSHFVLKLNRGKNIYRIEPTEEEFYLNYKPLRSLLMVKTDDPSVFFFHREGLSPQECNLCHTDKIPEDVEITPVPYGPFDPKCVSCHKSLIPENFRKHSPAANWLCKFCHEEKGMIRIYSGNPRDLCIRCHVNAKEFYKKIYVHGPVGTGDCTSCHNPHASPYQFQLLADKKGDVCIICHKDKDKFVHQKPNIIVHKVLTQSGCIVCHSPHATDYQYQLYTGPINQLCTSCHINYRGLKRGHPIRSHPVVGPKDPLRKGKRFGCSSCHNPHGSQYHFLLIGEIKGGRVCQKCHPY
ncbi:cytochrome c3 family protein [Thermodesulfatator atlanticus]|uniref:cytochrome c3 family protein n=1 Tax=Thermodesulfatator atlanticus TaxID=501497 RepID=UPI0003B38278|nr:cytochrome c3 family protein [Thermodesulfatator atlanticus]